jgi:hypothetical protein
MSSLIINWRFGRWFLQVEPWSDWARNRRWGRRNVTLTPASNRPRAGESWVSLYQGRRYAVALAVLLGLIVWAVVA